MTFDRITFNPKMLGGKACIRGMRIPVYLIVGLIAEGAPIEEILDEYPDLEREDIRAALDFAAHVLENTTAPPPVRTIDF